MQHLHGQDIAPPRAHERGRAAEQLIQDDAEGIDVRALIDEPIDAPALLGRHVRGRPQQRSGQRVGRRPPNRIRHLRDPEVDHLDPVAPAAGGVRDKEQIVGLQIAVNDPARVRRRQGPGRLHTDVDDVRDGQGGDGDATGRRPLAESLAIEKFHHHVRQPLGQNAHVEHLHDAGVIDGAGGAGLVEKAGRDRRIGHQLGQENLDRDPAPQQRVARLVHDAHPAPSQDADEGVIVDLATDQAFSQVLAATGRGGRRRKRRSRQRGQHHFLTRLNPPQRWR
jgi:hypothetical protein